jgi:hypothetical protein
MPHLSPIDTRHIINITTEKQLQEEVVKYLRQTDLLFCSSLGGFLDTDQRRIEAVKAGYNAGIPDIIIFTPCTPDYRGLAIELKAPSGFGAIKKNQLDWLSKLEVESEYFTMCSNNYTEIIEVIIKYTHGLL